MADLIVIVPSRGRPQNVARLIEAWKLTTATLLASLVVAVDADDPLRPEYERIEMPVFGELVVGPRQRLGGTLNEIARAYTGKCTAIGFMGDDHVPRTTGWELAILGSLQELGAGIVYGNDLLQGEKLPTAAFVTSDIIRTLGWMVPPGLVHLYIDDAWRELGHAMSRLRYMPDVVIEHLHPAASKAAWDDRYAEVNSGAQAAADKAAFDAWTVDRLPKDVAKLREAGLC